MTKCWVILSFMRYWFAWHRFLIHLNDKWEEITFDEPNSGFHGFVVDYDNLPTYFIHFNDPINSELITSEDELSIKKTSYEWPYDISLIV